MIPAHMFSKQPPRFRQVTIRMVAIIMVSINATGKSAMIVMKQARALDVDRLSGCVSSLVGSILIVMTSSALVSS